MLSTTETSIRRASNVLAVTGHSKKVMKGKKKGKLKAKDKHKAQIGSKSTHNPVKLSTSTPDIVCFHYNDKDHFKRECPKFLEEEKTVPSTSSIYIIEINFAIPSSNSWVMELEVVIIFAQMFRH
jgi:2-keto-4-pentenoate hydratase/2-oxohepta-3-ene-1,7-dioic acid hydratase in catechol pathway